MIERMKFISITGPKEDIDRVMSQYLSRYEIQLENALSELKTVTNLKPYLEINPYKEEYRLASSLIKELGQTSDGKGDEKQKGNEISLPEAIDTVRRLSEAVQEVSVQMEKAAGELEELKASREKVMPFQELNFEFHRLFQFTHVRYRFGRFPKEYFLQFEREAEERLDAIVYKCHEDEAYVSIVYFVPASISKKIDAIFASYHFERLYVPDDYEGTPSEAVRQLNEKITALEEEEKKAEEKKKKILEENREKLRAAYTRLASYSRNFDVRKLAACTHHSTETFYILCGWMVERDAVALRKELDGDDKIFCYMEDEHGNVLSTPPTKLKNPGLFQPFEMFIRMYGIPAYRELDPTILIGITYSVLFGFMFGDVGQGLVLFVGGLFLYRTRKLSLAAIISCCGICSTVFGFLFGSVFGFEDILEPLWLRPASHMTTLPLIGRLNTVFVVAIAIGMVIIVAAMVLNIVNGIRTKDLESAWFDKNGVAGLIFYGSVLGVLVLFMTGNSIPATALLAVMFGLPLLVIFFKEPLTALAERKSRIMPEQKGMFFVQGFFELFEMLLSYFSNTLSFVRVGAFAVSHAAMMEVVMMLAGAEAGNPNWAVVVLGNLIVCGMEGLIVGIQVLRLEYYEIFSRFYRGTGREFKPYGNEGILESNKN